MPKLSLLSLSILVTTTSVYASDGLDDLLSMSLEELTMLDVTMETASKFSQKLSDIPAAVYVLDGDRIQRSGVRTIAEALALVPGLNVTKFSETEFFVSTRGFHDGLYNKMLVMMDGRSLFSPVYGGVYWTDVDYILADIDRIEVLRGPGGAIWGGNAVSGVINIITKDTKETQGTYLAGTYGRAGDYQAAVRQGLQLNSSTHARAFYKRSTAHSYLYDDLYVRTREISEIQLDHSANDVDVMFKFGGEQGGYDRLFWTEHFDHNGSWYDFSEHQDSVESNSIYSQLSIEQGINSALDARYQFWVSRNKDEALDAPGVYSTVDADVSFNYHKSIDNFWAFGAGYRLVEIEFTETISDLDPTNLEYEIRAATSEREVDSIINVFAQNTYSWSDRLSTTVGAKVEYFEHTDAVEVSPQARFIYALDKRSSVWAGVARAIAAPSYMDTNTAYITHGYVDENNTPDNPWDDPYKSVVYAPTEALDLESVVTLETGYRFTDKSFEADITLFASQHDNVRGIDKGSTSARSDQFYHYESNDDYQLNSYGMELGLFSSLSNTSELYVGYSYLTADQSFTGNDSELDGFEENYSIEHQHLVTVQHLWQINAQWQFDLTLKGQILEYDPIFTQVPNYLALDARLAWQYSQAWPMVEAIIQNIGEKEGYQNHYSSYDNEQLIYARLSHEF